jgi:error-prone DNA polymerase
VGFQNPAVPWSEIERRLSDRRPKYRNPGFPGDGGDSPAWSRKREPYQAPTLAPPASVVPWAELHCHSNFSFLDGASHPEELVEEAVRLGLEALAITDTDGLYGVVRFAEAARQHGLATVFGSVLTCDVGRVAPASIPVLARDPQGYARLASVISDGQLAGKKGAPELTFDTLAQAEACNHWLVLTGTAKGWLAQVLTAEGPRAAAQVLARMVEGFGRANVAVELWDHGDPLDSTRNDALARLAVDAGVVVVATNDVRYHIPARRRLATAMAAVGMQASLDEADRRLPAGGFAHLRSGAEQVRRFARYPGAVEAAVELARACAFDLRLVAPQLPPFPCPPGHDEMSWLRDITYRGAARLYGERGAERVPGAYAQIDHELALIDELGFPGYFLVVWDIVEFCRRADILVQGRGSAANSAVCYALGITKADAVALGLLFERFLSPERDGPPDIDLDIESGRREEVIQYVYDKHGRRHAAQVANVITYRARSAVRDMAKALGFATGQQDAFSKNLDPWRGLTAQQPQENSGGVGDPRSPRGKSEGDGEAVAADYRSDKQTVPSEVLALAREIEHFPRHLGIHSGGMVMCDRPVVEVCPVEWATMADRTVLQWDKDDCARAGLVKFDLLGLGMLTALHGAIDLIASHHGVTVDLATIPQDDAVYDMLCKADSIGVFQVESRAQMATLPRLRPRTFYDLVVEVALIRPGPIQGGSVHPYIRRRNGTEPVTYLHPLLERSLAKTLGIPLFQEQLMQIAIDVGGFTPAEADELRQAMGSKRSRERMERLRQRFFDGMAERGITGAKADDVWDKLAAFANYGFPESHSVSFAYLVYASAWIKYHYPAAFCAALLNAQPMGFYSPHSLVQDARRHGVTVHTPDLNASGAEATLVGPTDAPEIRMGLSSIRHVGDDLAEAMATGRPYASIADLRRRHDVSVKVLEAMATAGAFGCFGVDRREALWTAGAVAHTGSGRLPGVVTGVVAPQLPGMSERDEALADLWASGVAPDGHPTVFVREQLDAWGVTSAAGLAAHPTDTKVRVAGVVTHRQRPATAGGTTFLNLEDEFGLINVIVSKGCWIRYRLVAQTAPALLVRGRLERNEGVVNVLAEHLEPLPVGGSVPSRDFR